MVSRAKSTARCGDVAGSSVGNVGKAEARLDRELEALRRALEQARRLMENGEEDALRAGALVARLCESAARVKLAQQKLSAEGDGFGAVRAEFEGMLRAMGLGEEEGSG